MPENIYNILKNVADFVAKIIDAIKQAFASFKPADSEESAEA